jgi:(2R)-ethylmalonyl-CoA mutase
MNTSMTINATAAWLLALYAAVAENHGVDPHRLEGTTQNDLIKEFLSRGTYVFPPEPSMRLISDMVAYSVDALPRWNPINICSYHLQEAGATPVQEIAYSFANAIAVLDAVRARPDLPADAVPRVFGRLSFFLNAGIRFVEEVCKARAMTELWDELGEGRYGVRDEKLRRFRYGVQVNSLGLTEAQPENNAIRIVLEALGVTLSKKARCRALQLPAWNEALGLPRPWDQQWSLRIQQILAYETDLLEYGDLFEGSAVVERKTAELADAAWAEIERILGMGGAIAAVESGYLKARLVESNARRLAQIESGERVVVGVNRFAETEPSELLRSGQSGVLAIDADAVRAQVERVRAHRAARSAAQVGSALRALRDALSAGRNVVPASIHCAHSGVTTGEWADALRETYGEYRAPTGVSAPPRIDSRVAGLEALRQRVEALSARLGRRLRFLIGKPGLDGHSSGAEQIALVARDAGIEVVYDGIRLTCDELAAAAVQEDVHLVGLSVLSGAHLELVPDLARRLDVPVVAGGIIPDADAAQLRAAGVAAVYTPRDYDLVRVVGEMVEIAARAAGLG